MKRLLFCFITAFVLLSCKKEISDRISIIPQPFDLVLEQGEFVLPNKIGLYTNLKQEDRKRIFTYLSQTPLSYSEEYVEQDVPGSLNLLITEQNNDLSESYILRITTNSITIEANDVHGIFYGIQSLLQLIDNNKGKSLPCLTISDIPRFPYRGFMFDVAHHYFSKEYIKRQLDMMAYFKLNTLQWHLANAAGWRIEIKKYPQLTEQAGWRPMEDYEEWVQVGKPHCTKKYPGAYGGYYTQEDIKELIAYAAERNITIIPSIDLFGSDEAVLAAFPLLSCTNTGDEKSGLCFCNEETFTIVQNILTEIIELFPSEQIYIGDFNINEALNQCDQYNRRIEEEKLQNTDQFKNYIISRIGDLLNSKGKKIAHCNGELSRLSNLNTLIINRKEVKGGITIANMHHNVVQSLDVFCDFNFYQDAPINEPKAMAGFLPIDKVYGYDPLVALPDSVGKYILGVQANLWTEYISTEEGADHMIWPRLMAFSEVAWTASEKKSLKHFRRRVLGAIEQMQQKGYQPFDLKAEVGPRKESLFGLEHKAVGKKVTYITMYDGRYAATNSYTFTDGMRGGWSYNDTRWQGFFNTDMDVVIDLDTIQHINSVKATFLQDNTARIWMPSEVQIYGSEDGGTYTLLGKIENNISDNKSGFFLKEFEWKGTSNVRSVRLKAKSNGKEQSWLFTDEIIVE